MSTADSLIAKLGEQPDDMGLCERAARALEVEERAAEALALLQQAFIHLNAHDPGILPCLCRRCIVPGELTTTAKGGTFHRDFVVAGSEPRPRVLFFWIPAELMGQRRRVRRSVQSGLRSRVA